MTTFLKKSNASSPAGVCGKAVTAVGRGHEMIEVIKMPMRIAPLTRYNMRNTVRTLDFKNSRVNFGAPCQRIMRDGMEDLPSHEDA